MKKALMKRIKQLEQENYSLCEYIEELEAKIAFYEEEVGNNHDLEWIIHAQEMRINELSCLIDLEVQ